MAGQNIDDIKLIVNSTSLSERQRRAVIGYLENKTAVKPLSKGAILRNAGYPQVTAGQPQAVFGAAKVKKVISMFGTILDDKKNLALKHITEKKLKKTGARDLAVVVDILNKNHRLEEGQSTDNQQFSLKELYKQSIDQ